MEDSFDCNKYTQVFELEDISLIQNITIHNSISLKCLTFLRILN